jgi:UDP-3-O-[3-hydroxymyristoyl] glucosamine N-acyltransferase
MQHPGFFSNAGPFTLAEVAKATGAELASGADSGRKILDVRALSDAGPSDVTFLDNRKYKPQLATTRAGAVLIQPEQQLL